MTMRDLLQELKEKEAEAKLGGGLSRIEKEHARGKLTARERIDFLFDPGTFFEIGMLADHRCVDFGLKDKSLAGDGVVTGYGLVNGRQIFAFAQDPTVMGGSLGATHAQKNYHHGLGGYGG
jgi:propionyl-CoA carboxylase beta chain